LLNSSLFLLFILKDFTFIALFISLLYIQPLFSFLFALFFFAFLLYVAHLLGNLTKLYPIMIVIGKNNKRYIMAGKIHFYIVSLKKLYKLKN